MFDHSKLGDSRYRTPNQPAEQRCENVQNRRLSFFARAISDQDYLYGNDDLDHRNIRSNSILPLSHKSSASNDYSSLDGIGKD